MPGKTITLDKSTMEFCARLISSQKFCYETKGTRKAQIAVDALEVALATINYYKDLTDHPIVKVV